MKKTSLWVVLCILAVVGALFALAPLWWHVNPSTKKENQASSHNCETRLRSLIDRSLRPEIVFGASLSFSGRYAAEGHRVREGYELWKEWVNSNGGIKVGDRSYPVRIIYRDDQSDPRKLIDNLQDLVVRRRVDFMLGPFSSSLTLEASRICEKYGVILVQGCGASERIFTEGVHCTFAVLTSASWYLKAFFNLISRLQPRPQTYVFAGPDRLFARSIAKGTRIWATQVGISEKTGIFTAPSEDYRQVVQIFNESLPDIIVFAGHYQDSVAFTRQLVRHIRYHPKAVVMTLGPTQRDYVLELGRHAEGIMGITQWAPNSRFHCPVFGSTQAFVSLFEEKFHHPPTYQNAQGAACGVVYQLALERARCFDVFRILQEIKHLDAETFYGPVKFDARGMNIRKPMAVIQIQHGQPCTIWPPELAEANPIYPITLNRGDNGGETEP